MIVVGSLTRCILCGRELSAEKLKRHVSRDFRGQQIAMRICVDDRDCVAAAARTGERGVSG